MFTGLIRSWGTIISLFRSSDDLWQLTVRSDIFNKVKIGDSIAINGCCLTVVNRECNELTFTLMKVTLAKTTFPFLASGQKVHVELAIKSSDRIEGHLLTGHISGIVYCREKIRKKDNSLELIFNLPTADQYLQLHGSVALDGVSLTVSSVTSESFSVNLLPYTQMKTLLVKKGPYNLELPGGGVLSMKCPDPMGTALELSKLGRLTAPSNPWVGCVITNSMGEVIATGYHRKRGEKHAEVNALEKLDKLEGEVTDFTLYCTLEPCNHTGLQPPCTESIIRSGIKRVVVGILDPDLRVDGRGITRLKEAGIEVQVLQDERVAKSLTPYITLRRTGRPYVVGKIAISLDGKISNRLGSSNYPISGEESRRDSHRLRAKSQAILIGTRTAVLDRPRLTVREVEKGITPLRCVLDLYGKVTDGPLLEAPTVIFTNDKICNPSVLELWQTKKVEVVSVPVTAGYLSLPDILVELGKRGILQLLVEGGSTLLTTMLELELIDKLIVYQSPLFLGTDGVPVWQRSTIFQGITLKKVKQLGKDVKLVYQRN